MASTEKELGLTWLGICVVVLFSGHVTSFNIQKTLFVNIPGRVLNSGSTNQITLETGNDSPFSVDSSNIYEWQDSFVEESEFRNEKESHEKFRNANARVRREDSPPSDSFPSLPANSTSSVSRCSISIRIENYYLFQYFPLPSVVVDSLIVCSRGCRSISLVGFSYIYRAFSTIWTMTKTTGTLRSW